MDTTPDVRDPYTEAIADILDTRKHKLGMTFEQLAEGSGVNVRTLKRLIPGQRPFKMGQFITVVVALGLDPADVIAEAETAVAAKSKLENSSL